MNLLYELILLIDVATAVLLYGPENKVAVVGKSAVMSCGSDDIENFAQWNFLGYNAKTDVPIYSVTYTRPGITVTITKPRIYTLKLQSVTSEDAGIYRCLLRKSEGGRTKTVVEFKADLIVFESHPVCTVNKSVDSSGVIAGEMLVLSCSVVYYGNWIPVMEWSRNDVNSSVTETTTTQNNKMITSMTKIVLRPEDNGVTFSCKTTFQSSVLSNNINRAPNYDLHWNYTLNVFYLVRSIEIEPKSTTYSPNDQLYCVAEGNPTPSCKWTDVETNEVLSHHCNLVLDEKVTVDRLHTLQCTAENTVANITNSTTIKVIFTGRHPFHYVAIGLGIIGLSLAILAIYFSRSYITGRICQRVSIQDESIEHDLVSARQSEYNLADENLLPMGNNHNGIHNNEYYGSDGTEYMEMNEACAECSNMVSITRPSIYEPVVYVEIDHRMNAIKLQRDAA